MKFVAQLFVLFLVIAPLYSQNEAPERQIDGSESAIDDSERRKRMERIAAEIRKRKALRELEDKWGKKREFDPTKNGAVYQPKDPKPSTSEKVSLIYRNLSVGVAAQAYSHLTGKEVMVSSTVSSFRLNFDAKDIPLHEAIQLFERSFDRLNIARVEIDDSIVVLIKNE